MTPIQKLLRISEVAERLDVSISTVWRLIKRGQLRAVHVGNNTRIDPADLDRYIEEAKTPDPATN